MCGLAGVILSRAQRTPAERETIWQQFSRLLRAAESRGRDAAGAAVVQRDGTVALKKLPVCASRFVGTTHFCSLRGAFSDATAGLLGHARLATKGSVFNLENNHPILLAPQPELHGAVVGIHNGTIFNDDKLFAKYGYERVGEVDSELAFHIAAEMCRWPGCRLQLLRASFGELRGPTAMAWVALDDPGYLFVARLGHPLSFVSDDALGVLYFASLSEHLVEALGARVLPRAFEDQRIYCFDTRIERNPLIEPYDSVRSFPAAHAVPAFEDLRRRAQRSEWARRSGSERETGRD